jgi:hypothetical protein
MAVIAFSDDRAWVKAAWAVRKVLADMLILSPDEPRIREVLDTAIALNGLNYDLVEEPTATRLKKTLEEVILATLQESESLGLKWKEGLDENLQAQYKEALQELADLMKG